MAKSKLSKKTPAKTSALLASKKKTLKKLAKTKKLFYALWLIILFGLLYLGRSLVFAAFVNGQPISRLSVVSELERRGGAEVLDTLITQALIRQEAKKQNMSVSDEELNKLVDDLETQFASQGGLDQVLTAEGMSREDLYNQLELQQLAEKILADKITVTDEEVASYLETNGDLMPEDATNEEKNDLAKNQLKQQKLSAEIQTWLSGLRQNANINYFVNY